MRNPETLVLTLCKWVKMHEERGETHCLNIGGVQYAVVDLALNENHFPHCTPNFVMELTHYFRDRIMVIDEVVCPDCRAEIDKEINTAIINANGIPPKEK